MSRYLNQRFSSLEPYVPGEQPQDIPYIKLNTNESPFPPSPGVLAAVSGEVNKLQLYSDPTCRQLSEKLAKSCFKLLLLNLFLGDGFLFLLLFYVVGF